MIKILFIDDNNKDFSKYKALITNDFSNQIKVFPFLDEEWKDLFDWGKLNSKLKECRINDEEHNEKIFEEILGFYKKKHSIDIFIIDNILNDQYNNWNIGIDLVNYLKLQNENVILLSSDNRHEHINKLIVEGVRFVPKDRDGETKLIKEIEELSGISSRKKTKIKKAYSYLCSKNTYSKIILFAFRFLILLSIVFGTLTVLREYFNLKSINLVQHNAIFDTVNAIVNKTKYTNSIKEFNSNFKNLDTPAVLMSDSIHNLYNNNNEVSEKSDDITKVVIGLLEFGELIFLIFLPFFILTGFLGYYNTYLRSIFLGERNDQMQTASSTASLKFSKSLFTSSIIATLIISILKKLLQDDKATLFALAPHGILLVILIGYLFILDKHNSDDEKENKK